MTQLNQELKTELFNKIGGLSVAHTTIYRWVMAYAPEIIKRCCPHLRSINDSWKVDETYLKVKGKNLMYCLCCQLLCRDSDFFLPPKRDGEAATRFLWKTLSRGHSHSPRVINTDKDKAYPKAILDLKESGLLPESVEHRAVKYLNNLIEQDHRFIKLRIIASQNFRNIRSTRKTISGYESINMIRKGQIKNVKRDDISDQIKFIHFLFGIVV